MKIGGINMTLLDTIVEFMKGQKDATATLKQINDGVCKSDYVSKGKTLDCSIRAIIYRHKDTFKRIEKGIYLLKGEKTSSLLINGDSRDLEEIDDGAINGCIITDHPWKDDKAHKSGNQKCFADYSTFEYTQEDFNNKARVLANGCFMVEFLPVESATNWEYLAKIKQMAKNAGLQYYASCIWRKAEEGKINNGRTTKGVEQFIIFSKGKPRRLAPKGKPYMTKNMLAYETFIPIKASQKHHQAEKPIELYEYLIENLTEEKEVCLDQFGGACNMIKAATNLNRFAIVYELSKEFVRNAINRFGMSTLFSDSEDEKKGERTNLCSQETEQIQLTVIPATDTEFQKKFLNTLKESSRKNILSDTEWKKLETANEVEIESLFKKANEIGYSEYKKVEIDLTESEKEEMASTYKMIDDAFCEMYDSHIRDYYENVRIENIAYAEYRKKVNGTLQEYLKFVKEKFPFVNVKRTENILSKHLLFVA